MAEHITVCDQKYDASTTPNYDLHSVSSLTTYQLRQELVRLGVFERFFPKERVEQCCYDTLLEAHITFLREIKAKEEEAQFARHNVEVEARKVQLLEAKAARKREAEERSRKRREAHKAALHADHGDETAADAASPPKHAIKKFEMPSAGGVLGLVGGVPPSKPLVEVVSSDDRHAVPGSE